MKNPKQIVNELEGIDNLILDINKRIEYIKVLNRKDNVLDDTYLRVTMGVFGANVGASQILIKEEIKRINKEHLTNKIKQ